MRTFCYSILMIAVLFAIGSCGSGARQASPETTQHLTTHSGMNGIHLSIDFRKGAAFNYPLMAIWAEDTSGHYLQDIYVAQSIAKGIFRHGNAYSGKWLPGEIRRPAALPYWGHRRGVKADDGLFIPDARNPLPDAVTGATPTTSFKLESVLSGPIPRAFYVLFEINQPWDWNAFWTNNKYPDDEDYKTSGQPAVVYRTLVNLDSPQKTYPMHPIGHSHYSGKDGNLYTDLSSLTTALHLADSILVSLE